MYEVTVAAGEDNRFHITWLNKQSREEERFLQEAPEITADQLNQLRFNPLGGLDTGKKLYRFLDGDAGHLTRALTEAGQYGGSLVLHLRECSDISHWPFELLARGDNYLPPYRLHLVRCLSPWGEKKKNLPENRPLRLLFMACSTTDSPLESNYEKDEETIFKITENIPVDMDVEDSGSLEGLRRRLELEQYDVVHLSGYTGTDDRGRSYFVMEDEAGGGRRVSPDQLWREALIENPPRMLFFSATPASRKPGAEAAAPFSAIMVDKYRLPASLEWERPVGDERARHAAETIYRQLTRGKSILDAVQRCRYQLITGFPSSPSLDWSFLRLFSTGQPLGALVKEGRKQSARPRYITNNHRGEDAVEGFVGRRRPLQHCIKTLLHDGKKIGVLLHGAAGVGKSALAGKIRHRFKDHTVIPVLGALIAPVLTSALKDAFVAANDTNGLSILESGDPMAEQLTAMCAAGFRENNYLLLLDNFEQNLEGADRGRPDHLLPEAAEALQTLLHYLPLSGKMTQLIITSRYLFSLTEQSRDLVKERLEPVCLSGFHAVEQRKKVRRLKHIFNYGEPSDTVALTAAGRGNPLLMEWLDQAIGSVTAGEETQPLEDVVKKTQTVFNQKFHLPELVRYGGSELEHFLRCVSVFRRPVTIHGLELVGKNAGMKDWRPLLLRGIELSLVEIEHVHMSYRVTPLMREELWDGLDSSLCRAVHRAAFHYFQNVCETMTSMDPLLVEEWIFHALGCGEEGVASQQAGRLIDYLFKRFSFSDVRRIGEWVLECKNLKLSTSHDASLLNNLARAFKQLGHFREAADYFQQALDLDVAVSGPRSPNVAKRLNNLGAVWTELGDFQRGIDYLQQALTIDEEVYGPRRPSIADRLNNLGTAWLGRGDAEKAFAYFQRASAIFKEVYGDMHPHTAAGLSHLGTAWRKRGDAEKALDYYQQALAILKALYGEAHPRIAAGFGNLGTAWSDLGNYSKAFEYFQSALGLLKEVYGDIHPDVAGGLRNLGSAWLNRGENRKAIDCFLQALAIFKELYGDTHHQVAIELKNLGLAWAELGESQKAVDCFQQAYEIFKTCYGEEHPLTVSVKNKLVG